MQEQTDTGGVYPTGGAADDGARGRTRWIIFGVAAICAVVFVLQNRERVTIHFLFFDISSRVWIGFVICLALGALLGALIGRWWKRRKLES